MKKRILTAPHPLLRKKSQLVGKIDQTLLNEMKTLKMTLFANKQTNMGLAGPQIGILKQIFVGQMSNGQLQIFINPRLLNVSKERNVDVMPREKLAFEGCLSIPNIYALIKRAWEIEVEYASLDLARFKKGDHKLERPKIVRAIFTGLDSTLIQHEIDHLNGILFVDRALEQKTSIFEWSEKSRQLHEIGLGLTLL